MIDFFQADATGYYPVDENDPAYKMEGGKLDRLGNPIYTLDEFKAGRAPYVTVAMDAKALPYGTTLTSPDFPDIPFKVADTGSAFHGKGLGRIDIARASKEGANSSDNNGKFTFQIAGAPIDNPATSIVPQQGVIPDMPSFAMPDLAPNALSRIDMLSAIDPSETSYTGNDLLGQAPDLSNTTQEDQPDQPDETQAGGIKLLDIPHPDPRQLTQTKVDPDGTIHYKGGYSLDPSGEGILIKEENGFIIKWPRPGSKAEVITPKAAKNPIYKQNPETKEFFDVTDPQNPKPLKFPEEKLNLPEGATGEDAIKGLSTQDQAKVKGWASYDRRPPMSGNRSDPSYNRLYPYIKAYNPDYDETDFPNASNIKKQFYSSSPTTAGGQITSVNTAIDHLGTLYDAAEKLDGAKLRKYNSVAQYIATETGNPDVIAFNAARDKVNTEIARAFRGGVPTNLEIEEGNKALNAANSPEQIKAVVTHIYPEMLNARLGEIGYSYENFFGKPFPGLVRPSAKRVLDRFGVKDFGTLEEQKSETTSPQTAKIDMPGAIEAAKRIMADPNASPEAKANAQKLLSGL